MSNEILLSKIFKNPQNGWDAFALSIKKLDILCSPDDQFYLDSDIIPTPILSYFDHLIDAKYVYHEDLDLPEYGYLTELLEIVAEQIILDKRNACFFYPLDFLDQEFDLDIKKISQFIRAKSDFRNSTHSFIDETLPYHLFYINQLLKIPKPSRNRSFYTKKRIDRNVFETHIVNFQMADAYVEVFTRCVRFVIVVDRNKNNWLACAISQFNRVMLVINISNHSKL